MIKNINLRKPCSEDGPSVHQLISECPPLDTNSVYCNLLQCTYFQATCVIAECDQRLCGFTSAYIAPDRPDTLFIWQVAVPEAFRGQGLAKRMIQHLLQRQYTGSIDYLETTITEANQASWRLFESLAKQNDTPMQSNILFDLNTHFNGKHDSEFLVRIGPLNNTPSSTGIASVN
jgi:L-2,4-diaminobutyric acid acetyltransferase